MSATALASLAAARAQDAAEPLQALRAQFVQPRARGAGPAVYLCGHSLGLAPREARRCVDAEIADWEELAVTGHHSARRPWAQYTEDLRAPLARLVGAAAEDVLLANSLTINLHLLLASFFRPTASRWRILIEAGAFSSDRHAIESQLRQHGLDPADALIEIAPPPAEDCLAQEQIEAAIHAAGSSLAIVLWPGVQYRTGQAFELAAVARAAHAVGALVGFDHAHAIGNLPLALMDDDADFAVWCSYKYLNGGPGAVGGLFVHPRHAGRPRLAGWWGHDAHTRFQMQPGFVPAAGAAGWAVSNPPVFSSAPLHASLALFERAGIAALRARSMALTGALHEALGQRFAGRVQIVTPADPVRRGCQLSLRFASGGPDARQVFEGLFARDVIGDFRAPDVLRVAPVPLYNGFEDLWRFLDALDDVMGRR